MPITSTKKILGIYIATLVLFVFLTYSPCLRADFTNWDDDRLITQNRLVQHLSWRNLPHYFETTVNKTYTPLTLLSFSLDVRLWGQNPFFFHLTNLVLHLVVTLLIFFLSQRLGIPTRAAFLTALIFALHPLHVESVAWIAARKDLLFSIFYLTSLYFYWNYIKTARGSQFIFAFIAGLCSMLAKPMAISLPLVLFLFDKLAGRPWTVRRVIEKVPFLLTLPLLAAITAILNARPLAFTWPDSILVWLWCGAFYIKKFFLPVGLCPIYPLPRPISFFHPSYLSALLIFLSGGAFLWRQRQNKWLIFAGLYYIFSTFFLWRYDTVDPSLVADRFMYLSCFGFCLWGGISLNALLKRTNENKSLRHFMWAGSLIVGIFLASQTFTQCRIWNNSLSLWNYAIAKSGGSSFAFNNRGEFYSRQGQHLLALADFKKAVTLDPLNVEAYYNLGVTATLEERYDEALVYYSQAIKINPSYAQAYNNRGFIYGRQKGEADSALYDLNKAIRLEPFLAEAYNNRGFVYDRLKNEPDLALADFSRAIALKPSFPEAFFFRGIIWGETKNNQALAIKDFDQAIRLDPGYAEAFSARGVARIALNQRDLALADFNQALTAEPASFPPHINRGSLFLQAKDYPQAILNYSRALELRPDDILALRLRAEAYTLADDLTSALADCTKVITLAPTDGQTFFQRAQVYQKMGQRAAALADAQQAEKLGVKVSADFFADLKKQGEKK